jgi:hypothetical protein
LEASSDGLRFFLLVRTGGGTSSSCDAFRFRSDRVPSGGSSGRMRSLNIEWPPGSTPRCDGSKSLASFGTDDSLRRVMDSDGSPSSSFSSCKSFCIQALHRQCFEAVSVSQVQLMGGREDLPSSWLSVLASRAHCVCAAGTKAHVSYRACHIKHFGGSTYRCLHTQRTRDRLRNRDWGHFLRLGCSS